MANSFDMKISIKVSDFTWEGQLSEIAQINDSKIRYDLGRQASLVAWFGVLQVEADDAVEKIENDIDALKEDLNRAKAEAELEIRTTENPKIKITDNSVAAQVQTHKKVAEIIGQMRDKRDVLRKANNTAGKLAKIMKALDHKKEMLISIVKIERDEDRAHGATE